MKVLRDYQDRRIRVTPERWAHIQEHSKGDGAMARKIVKLWYDPEADYLEVLFERRAGYFRETTSSQVMEKVDTHGRILGFSVLRVSALKRKPLEVALV